MAPPHPPIAQPHDIEFFERELASFVPNQIFDAHAHLWANDSLPAHRKNPVLPPTVGLSEFSSMQQELHPGRHIAANVFHRITEPKHLAEANT